jgi:hypothetical protein
MRIGIITCEILRREIKDVIETTGYNKLFFPLLETRDVMMSILHRKTNSRFIEELKNSKSELGARIEIKEKSFERTEKEIRETNIADCVIIKVNAQGMHFRPAKLLAEIERDIKKMSRVVDFVLLGYGLCGNTVENVERLIADADVPVVISREKGVILNNSIEIALGRKRVQSLLHAEGGTYFLTPAGASAIKDTQLIPESDGILGEGKGIDVSKIIKLFKSRYKRVIKVCYSDADEKDPEYSKIVADFAKKFGLEIKTERGSSKLVLDALQRGFDSVHNKNKSFKFKKKIKEYRIINENRRAFE